MQGPVVVVSSDPSIRQTLVNILTANEWRTVTCNATGTLEKVLPEECMAVLIDLDHERVDNRFFTQFRKAHSAIEVMGLSSRSFHPELQEAFGGILYACLKKPVDADELLFLLKSLQKRH